MTRQFSADAGIANVSFQADQGELITLLGPSGCGKTTTLRCIAGLEMPDQGTIVAGGAVLADVKSRVMLAPERRNLGMVFQSYALWPHLSVAQNIALPLRAHRVARDEIARRVREMLELVELSALAERFPSELSGGQQQRVALARAIAYHPRLLLLDEPLSNLDAALRASMRRDIRRLQQEAGITAVYVTHDQDEALSLSDSIVVMRHGSVVQVGSPSEVYYAPASRFVASLLGAANYLEGTVDRVVAQNEPVRVAVRGLEGAIHISATAPPGIAEGTRVFVLWRPGSIEIRPARALLSGPVAETVQEVPGIAEDESSSAVTSPVTGVVERVSMTSVGMEYTVTALERPLQVLASAGQAIAPGDAVELSCSPSRAFCLTD